MNPSISPDRHSHGDNIQRKQDAIDKLDQNLDSRVDIEGLSKEEQESLKKVYIDKVNTLQGRIRRGFTQVDVARDTRSPEWRNWEKALLRSEAKLYSSLSKEYKRLTGKPSTEGLDQFAQNIDQLITEVSGIETGTSQRKAQHTVEKMFTELGVPDAAKKAQKAVDNYGQERVRTLLSSATLYNALSEKQKEDLFGTQEVITDTQLVGILANNTLESSPLAFVATETFEKLEGHVLQMREETYDRMQVLTEEQNTLLDQHKTKLLRLCKTVKEDVSLDTVSKIYAWAWNLEGYPEVQEQITNSIGEVAHVITENQKEQQALEKQIVQMDYAFNQFDSKRATINGQKDTHSQLLFRSVVDYGIEADVPEVLRTSLREAQREQLDKQHDASVDTSIKTYNEFARAHPELDELDRADLYRLIHVSEIKPDDARFETVNPVFKDPMELFDPMQSSLSIFETKQSEPVTIIKSLGNIPGGSELVMVDLPHGPAIACKDPKGVVRLQDGSVVENPKKRIPLKIDTFRDIEKTVYVTEDTKNFIQSRVGSPDRIVLRSKIEHTPLTTLDGSQLQIVRRTDDGSLEFRSADDTLESTVDTEGLLKQQAEHGHDVLRSIKHHPLVKDLSARAGTLHSNMNNMQTVLSAALSADAHTSQAYIDQMRDYARPMLGVLSDPETETNALEAKTLLESKLKQMQTGEMRGLGMELELQKQLSSLNDYIDVLTDNSLKHQLETAMTLRPKDWASWRSKEGVIMLGSITAAVVVIVATGGSGLVPISAYGAAGGIVGAQATKELLYQYHNRSGGGASKGEYLYRDGSNIGNYFRGEKLYDPNTGQYIEMSFLKNVASPLAQEFAMSFATTFLALGAGQYAAKGLSTLVQKSGFAHMLSKNSVVANKILRHLSKIKNQATHVPENFKEKIATSLRQILDEIGDEISEGTLEKAAAGLASAGTDSDGLFTAQRALGFLATFAVCTAKGFRPLRGGQLGYSSSMDTETVRSLMEEQGHTIVSEKKGIFDVKTHDGLTLIVKPVETGVDEAVETEEAKPEMEAYEDQAVTVAQQMLDAGLAGKGTSPLHRHLSPISRYSRETLSNERRELAHRIRASRSEYQRILQQTSEYEVAHQELEQQEAGIQRQLEHQPKRHVLARRRGRKDIESIQIQKSVIEHELQKLQKALREIDRSMDGKRKRGKLTPGVQKMINDFQGRQLLKWRNAPYSNEELQQYFNPEYLAELSLEEYQELLRRFPSHLVTHVTRQGVRDHKGLVSHGAGVGQNTDGFKDMVEDGRLLSPLGVAIKDGMTEESIKKLLVLENVKSREEALKKLKYMTNPNETQGTYADRNAIHIACEEVADCYYGSETGNEIFVVFPSALIASQYYFSGTLNEGGSGYWNDTWVWDAEGRGIDLNAGVVFIPADAQVDPETGSRYAVEEGKAVVHKENVQSMYTLIEDADFIEFATSVQKIWERNGNNAEKIQVELQPYQKILSERFGISDSRLQEAMLDYTFLNTVSVNKGTPYFEIKCESVITKGLQRRGIYFREASTTVSSREYWERYFENHPEKKPSKIVYYSGGNPTKALHNWQKGDKKSPDKHIGFPERRANTGSGVARRGIKQFEQLARRVIDEHFAE